MNWLDWTLGILLAISIMEGLRGGLVRIVIGTLALPIAFLVGANFYPLPAVYVKSLTHHEQSAELLGFIALFVGVLVAGSLLTWALQAMLRTVGLSWVDHLLGGGFGFGRAIAIAAVTIMALVSFAPPALARAANRSILAPYLMDSAHILVQLAPNLVQDGFEKTYRHLHGGQTSEESAQAPPEQSGKAASKHPNVQWN